MARFSYEGFKECENVLGRMSRGSIRRIVEAGGNAAALRMRENIRQKKHIKTGDMLNSTGMTDYLERLGGGSVEVYPLGDDRKGVRNALKAFVANYGKGWHQKKSGDHFITGDKRATERVVYKAMAEENLKILEEARRG